MTASLLIRADAGGDLGTGHVMRMLALAQGWLERGGSAVIASVSCPEPLRDRLNKEGVTVRPLSLAELGGSEDLRQTIDVAEEHGAQWVVLDGYHFDLEYQRSIRGAGLKVMVMDDYGHCEKWCADLILNQNIGSEKRIYPNEVSDGRILLGPTYGLLRKEFWTVGRTNSSCPAQFPLRNLLVTLGGADPDNVTGLVLEALLNIQTMSLKIRVVIGPGNPNAKALAAIVDNAQHCVEFVHDATDMSPHYQWAGGIISAGGSTCYEWMLFGLNGAVVNLAANQTPIIEGLVKQGVATDLGSPSDWEGASLAGAITEWMKSISSKDVRTTIVDGKGAFRVGAALGRKLTISVATARDSWINAYAGPFIEKMAEQGHLVTWIHDADEIPESDILFLLSFWTLVPPKILRKNVHNLVVHESALPKGRGWSPVSWQVLEGRKDIPVCLFEARKETDSGEIFIRSSMALKGHELIDEIRREQALITMALCEEFVGRFPEISSAGSRQEGDPSFYRRRTFEDSRLDLGKSLHEQFNLLRIVDNQCYPAFFDFMGKRYVLSIRKDLPPPSHNLK